MPRPKVSDRALLMSVFICHAPLILHSFNKSLNFVDCKLYLFLIFWKYVCYSNKPPAFFLPRIVFWMFNLYRKLLRNCCLFLLTATLNVEPGKYCNIWIFTCSFRFWLLTFLLSGAFSQCELYPKCRSFLNAFPTIFMTADSLLVFNLFSAKINHKF